MSVQKSDTTEIIPNVFLQYFQDCCVTLFGNCIIRIISIFKVPMKRNFVQLFIDHIFAKIA